MKLRPPAWNKGYDILIPATEATAMSYCLALVPGLRSTPIKYPGMVAAYALMRIVEDHHKARRAGQRRAAR